MRCITCRGLSVSSNPMIRKQLYITPEQDRALKDHARKQGLSEAEIVREALDRHLRRETDPLFPQDRRRLVEELIQGNRRLAEQLRFPRGYKFNREELYAEREERRFSKQEDG